MKKNYITPKTQVKTLDTEMPIAESVTIDPNQTTASALAKKGVSIWEED